MAALRCDHLLYAGPDLEQLRRDVARRSGVDAAAGGRHEKWGTHNALIGLGAGVYLELIAPEPGSTGPWGELFGRLSGPSLQAWCVRAGPADEVQARLEDAAIDSRRVPGGRRLADGSMLTWELVFPRGHAFGGALPFFIDWKGSPHPSASLQPTTRLIDLKVEHPDADALERVFSHLGALPPEVAVVEAPDIGLAARFATAGGEFELAGQLDAGAHLGAVDQPG